MSQARLREALTAGGPSTKEKGPPVADGTLTVTPDTPEAIEWRSRRSVIDSIASCSSYLDDDEDDLAPGSLYGKFTWKIDKFNEVSKRELRSNTFEVGGYKWYVLVYPQGCDVSNHLSLFLCVADYDKLLPGWSHFAQFTIAVVNRDPKRSKYSDTLHRFCKKEHDWGWKKFMELGKVTDGFTSTAQDTLVIKAQVQVIRDRVHRPFKCLDAQYRRELVRVYLSNVEGIARRFVEEKREYLAAVVAPERGLRAFWSSLGAGARAELAAEPAGGILKGIVKRFFNEKEVTSTLVMDALYCGAKALEDAGRRFLATGSMERPADAAAGSASGKDGKGGKGGAASAAPPRGGTPAGVLIDAESGTFFFAGDVVDVLERAVADLVPAFTPDKPSDGLALRNAQEADDYSRDGVERDEIRLSDLGRRAVEMFAAAFIASERIEAAWVEAETIKRQEALIAEEEEMSREESERQAARAEADKEKRARKKEKQKKKKEAEREKREAEEAERAKAEEGRRAEQERRQREAEERRRKEEESREAERAKSAASARHVAEQRRAVEASAKAKAKHQAAEEVAAAATAKASSPPGEDLPSATTSAVAGGSALSSSATSRAGTPEGQQQQRSGEGAGAPRPERGASPRSGSDSSAEDQVEALRAQVSALEEAGVAKDIEIASLQARVAQLESQLAVAAALSAPPSPGPSRPASAAGSGRRTPPMGVSDAGGRSPLKAVAPEAPAANGAATENGHAGPRAAAAAGSGGKGLPGQQQQQRPAAMGGFASSSPSGAILATASMSAAIQRPQAGASSHLAPPLGSAAGAATAVSSGMMRQQSAPAVQRPVGQPSVGPARLGGMIPAMNPGAVQFNPGSAAGPLPFGKAGMAPGPKPGGGLPGGQQRLYSHAGAGAVPGQQGEGGAAAGGTYRAAAMGTAHLASSLHGHPGQQQHGSGDSLLSNGDAGGMFAGGGAQVGSRAFSSPLPDPKRLSQQAVPQESPVGMDDFAHLGLITDLLE